MKDKKAKSKSGKSKKKAKSKAIIEQRELVALIGFLILIAVIVFILSLSGEKGIKPAATINKPKIDEPPFTKEGELFFLDKENGDTLKEISIEIADNNSERSQGLMYRSSMADSLGMLFIFDRAEEQSFWMKNTILTLDILYADENGILETLYKYTTPYSEDGIPSLEKAKYVIEVPGGFTDRYKITKGDKILFTRIE